MQASFLVVVGLTGLSGWSALSAPPAAAEVGNTFGCIYTPQDFADAFLEAVSEPVTPSNFEAIVAWEEEEGGNWNNTATFNPLNTTHVYDGSVPFFAGAAAANHGVPVQAYKNWGDGLEATVLTIEDGLYKPILSALTQGNSPLAVAQAIDASPWGTHLVTNAIPPSYSPPAPSWEPRCPAFSSAPSVVAPGAGEIDVVAEDPTGNTYRAASGASGWAAPALVGTRSNVTPSAPAAVVFGGQEDVFVTGTDHRLYENTLALSGGTWSGFYAVPIPAAFAFVSSPTVAAPTGTRVDVFGEGTDGHIYRVSYTGAGWTGASLVGSTANATSLAPGVVAQGGQEDVFVTGTDRRLYEDMFGVASGAQTGFFGVSVPGPLAFVSGPAVTALGAGVVDVLGRGTDSHVYRIRYTAAGWSGAGLVGTAADAARFAPGVVVAGGQEDVFVTGTDQNLYEDAETLSTSAWTGFFQDPVPSN